MKHSYQHFRRVYQTLDTDRLKELGQLGGLTRPAASALKEELWSRGIKYSGTAAELPDSSNGTDEPESGTGAATTALLRLVSTGSIFFMVSLTLGSQPIRSRSVDIGQVIANSIEFVFIGPGLLFYQVFNAVGVLISIVFWSLLILTALGSNDARFRRWFYGLLTMYIVLTLLGLLASIGMGLIAMAHA